MRTESLDFLRRLLDTPSPSGHETAGQRIWLDEVRKSATDKRRYVHANFDTGLRVLMERIVNSYSI